MQAYFGFYEKLLSVLLYIKVYILVKVRRIYNFNTQSYPSKYIYVQFLFWHWVSGNSILSNLDGAQVLGNDFSTRSYRVIQGES